MGETDFREIARRKAELGLSRDVAYPVEERAAVVGRSLLKPTEAAKASAVEATCMHCYGDLNLGHAPDECTGYCLGG